MRYITYFMLLITLIMTSCSGPASENNAEIVAQNNISTPTSAKAKINIFNDIGKARRVLSENGIGDLGDWKSDQMGGFFSITNYFPFGNGVPQNNLAYYLQSVDESYIQTLTLILNINDKSEKEQALARFKELVFDTFKSLSLEVPKGFAEAMDNKKEFKCGNSNFTASVKLEKSKIDSWILKIETK